MPAVGVTTAFAGCGLSVPPLDALALARGLPQSQPTARPRARAGIGEWVGEPTEELLAPGRFLHADCPIGLGGAGYIGSAFQKSNCEGT